MRYYLFDASALVYAYTPALPGVLDFMRSLPKGGCRAVVCDTALPEAVIQLISGRSNGRLTADQLSEAIAKLRRDFLPATSPFLIIEASSVVGGTPDYFQLYDISPLASIVLGAALALRTSLPPDSDLVVVTVDDNLSNALGAEGIVSIAPYQLGAPEIDA